MSGDTIVLDPRVEELLREVASQPGSALLRMPRPKVMRTLAAHQKAFGPATAGLTLAERELVRAHRGELAFVLRQACIVALLDERKRGAVLARTAAVSVSANEADLRDRMRSLGGEEDLASDEACRDGLALLARCVSGSVEDYSVSQLAAASHRLAPSNLARHHAALEALEARMPKTANALFGECLRSVPDEPMRVAAITGLASAHALEERYERAADLLERAGTSVKSTAHSLASRFVMRLFVGDKANARAFGQEIEALVQGDVSVLETYVEQARLQRSRGRWRPTETFVLAARGIRGDLGPRARRIVDVVL